jgi:hypothetical protein
MYLAGLLIYGFCISLTVPSHWGPRVPRFCAHGEDAQQGVTKDLPSILVAWEIFGGFNGNFNGNIIFHGWWVQPPEKYESVGIIIPNIWTNKRHVPKHQPEYIYIYYLNIEKTNL